MAEPAAPTSMGIDFGTSNTVAMWTAQGRPVMPLLFDGSPMLPSAVFAGEDTLLTGRDAERAAMSKPAAFEPHPKRCLTHGTVLLDKGEYRAETLVTAVLSRVAHEAYRVLGHIPGSLVMTHPAEWGAGRLRLLAQAALQAGFPEPMLTPEPVAATTHFSAHLGHRIADGSHMVVYDLGGGTFDVSVVRCDGGTTEVVATGGLADMGGIDIDFAVIEHLERTYVQHAEGWQRLRRPRTPADRRHRRGLWRDVRDAKELLSRESTASLFIPILDVDAHVTRQELEQLAGPLLRQTVDVTLEALESAGVALDAVSGLFLVGGASRMPLSSTLLMRQTRIAPTVLEQPELVVASGALSSPVQPVPADDAWGGSPEAPVVPAIPRQVYRGVARVPPPVTAQEPSDVSPWQVGEWPWAPLPEEPLHTAAMWTEVAAEMPTQAEMQASYDGEQQVESAPVAEEATANDGGGGEDAPQAEAEPAPAPATASETEDEDGFTQSRALSAILPPVERGVLSLALRHDRQLAVVRGRSVVLLEWATREVLAVLDDHADTPSAVRWSPDRACLAVACGAELKLWPVDEDGRVDVSAPRGYVCPERVLELAWNGEYLASGDTSQVVVWNAETGERAESRQFSTQPELSQLRALEWSPDGAWLAAGGSCGEVTIWPSHAEGEAMQLSVAPVAVRSVAWSPDGEWLVTGDAGGGLAVWQLSDALVVQSITQAHDGAVQCVAWSGDGKLLASGGVDSLIRIWDAGSGRQCAVLEGHAGVVNVVDWCSDGVHLISGGADDTVRVWQAEEGRELS